MELRFQLKHQEIKRLDRNVVASGSRNYVTARFIPITDDWSGIVTAIFDDYFVVLDENLSCHVPYEVLKNKGQFSVSAFCGDLHTATEETVLVMQSGYRDGIEPGEPAPDVYSQIVSMVNEAVETANSVREDADAGLFIGPQGPAGETGATGPQGPAGEPGPAGETGPMGPAGPQGEKGDPFVYEDFTPQQLEALTGPQGPQGPAGPAGPAGTTPQISVTATTLPAGQDVTVQVSGPAEAPTIAFGIPQGEPGERGPQGEPGPAGAGGQDGKSAYAYAHDGGFTGTEEDFAEKLAQEQLTGTTEELTPTQVYEAVAAGIPVKVQYTSDTYGLLSFTAFNVVESMYTVVSQSIVYYNGIYVLTELYGNRSTNEWGFKSTTLAEKTDIPDIPEKLPNPHALTFSGAVTGNYDGSSPLEIAIDSGLDNSVPDYVTTEAETVARIVNRHQSNDSVIFPFLSDAHCGYYTDPKNGAAKLAGQLLNLIGKRAPFDFIVHAGDFSTGAWNTTRDSTYQDTENYTELTAEAHTGIAAIWVPGNHDDAPYMATEDRATQKDVFTLIGRKNRLSGAVCPNGCNYGYMDLDNRKLRVIYLDTDDKRRWGTVAVGAAETPPDYLNAHNVGGEQLLWLANTALDFTDKTNPTEWSIIVVSHVALNISGTIIDAVSGTAYAHSTENAATILNAYKNGKRGSITHNDVTVEYDFSTLASRAVVICCVHGHNHSFCDEMVGSILSIGCPNVMNGREQESSDGNTYTKTAGTADGTSFCILTIDRENCMIYADCVGVGYDREFTFTSETIAYTNQIPISTDTDGSVYNGVGYQAGYRLGSSGTPSAESSSYITGFIPCKVGDVVRMKNITFQYGVTSGLTSNNQRLSFYDSSKTHLLQTNATGLGGVAAGIKGDDDIWTQFRPQKTMDSVDCSNVAYFRINAAYIGDDSIITVNETID